jgi:hypothetical protein
MHYSNYNCLDNYLSGRKIVEIVMLLQYDSRMNCIQQLSSSAERFYSQNANMFILEKIIITFKIVGLNLEYYELL